MSYLEFCAIDISPCSFTLGQAFHRLPKPPFSWFVQVIAQLKMKKKWMNEKMKKWKKYLEVSGDVIILHICTKNHNHIMYRSWDIRHDRVFLSFWAIFCSFTPNRLKNQFKKNEKNTWRYHLFTLVYHKWHLFLRHDVWFLRYGDIPS